MSVTKVSDRDEGCGATRPDGGAAGSALAPAEGGIDAVAPNLKRRLSGVTATIARLVPVQSRTIGIVATGPGLPAEVPHLPLARVLALPRRRPRVWHARRNTEMLLGLGLRHVLRKDLRLVFTSASQRQHTAWTRWLIARMDAVVVPSARSQGYLRVPSVVVPHGIDTERFRPPADRPALRRELGLPDGVLIGCFGRIRAQKGTDVFVEAMLDVLRQDPAVTGLVMGSTLPKHRAFAAALRDRVAAAGMGERVRFLPEVPVAEVARWYQALDLFVAPQRHEGFGLTPLEAMACGVPVVATPVGAFEEQVVPGETGLIVPPGDPAAMAAAIEEAVAAVRTGPAWSEQARRHACRSFGIEREAAALNDLYATLLPAAKLPARTGKLPISAFVICKDEARVIEGCLRSLADCAEIVVVDSGSRDGTLDIVARLIDAGWPIRLLHQDWLGYGGQKQFALAQCTQPWCLSLDSDERLSPAFRAALPRLVATGPAQAGWKITRYPYLTGYGYVPPACHERYHLRLFRRGRARFDPGDRVHEGLAAEGRVFKARQGGLLHFSPIPLEAQILKANRYSSLKAGMKRARGQAPRPWKMLVSPPVFFLRWYLRYGLWRCGWAGFIQAATGSIYAFLTEAKRVEAAALERVPPEEPDARAY